MRASLASLLVTSLALASTTPAVAGPKKRPAKAKKKKAAPAAPAPAPESAPTPEPSPAPEPSPTPEPAPDGANALGDPATSTPPPPATLTPPTSAPATPAPAPQPADPVVPPKLPTKQAKAQAKALQKEATRLYNVQQYAEAADRYQQAYLLVPNPAYLYASAQSQRLGGDCPKALLSYQAYLRANPPESERAKATANIERCEQEIREREAAVNADQITVPYDVPAPPPPPPEEAPIVVIAPPPPEKSYVAGHVLLGLGVVAIGGGSYLYYTGRKALDDHNASPTFDDYVAGLDDVDKAKQKQTYGLIAAGGGLALIGGAIVYYVLHSRSSSEESPPPVQATVSADSATLTFTGKF